MKEYECPVNTRKRCRNNMTRRRERPSLSRPSLLWMFAAAAMVTSPLSSSSSTESTTTTKTNTNTNAAEENDSNSNIYQDELQTANVRRGGRAFVRQHQQKKQEKALERDDDSHDEDIHDYFLLWCQDYLAIDTRLVEIDYFEYPNYLRAMEDRIDIFCDDCNDDDEADYDYFQSDNNVIDTHAQSAFGNSANIHSLDESDRYLSVNDEYPPVSVRGLKASRDISVGEVVLSIPHSALWTVHNAIDASRDSNLINSMGKEARKARGWESPGMDDIPLLAITLLYHLDHYHNDKVGELDYDRPHYAPYLDILELQNNKLEDSIPHLWDSRKLRKSATPEVRRVAKGIRQDVVELYESIVTVLIENHPAIFGKNRALSNGGKNAEDGITNDDNEWMYSLEKFHWAFALVNSRHWHLQIPDDPFAVEKDKNAEDTITNPNIPESNYDSDSNSDEASPSAPEDDHESFTDQEGPPAATPTDEWVVIQDEKLREEEERELQRIDEKKSGNENENNPSPTSNEEEDYDYWPSGNSFLAPLADLLNFGPPCTRGIYNPDSMAFEIVATCEFQAGQEITFWYADACEDVFVANYGFTMPMMVPKCDEQEQMEQNRANSALSGNFQWQQQQQEQQQQYLEDELFHAYEEMDRLDQRLDYLMNVLEECQCGNQTELLEGAWNYPNDKEKEENKRNVGKLDLPRSPSPPPPKNNETQKDLKKGADAQHAIRDGRKSKKSGNNEHQHKNRHKRHHAKTRFRSRSHQDRRLEF